MAARMSSKVAMGVGVVIGALRVSTSILDGTGVFRHLAVRNDCGCGIVAPSVFLGAVGERVCPSVATFVQSRQRPSSLRRWRSSVALTRLSSRFCPSVSLGFGARVALLRLLAADPFLMVCLLAL